MSDSQSYRLEDFIPFSPEVYFRLVERINEAWWPLQFLALGLGLAALAAAWRGRVRVALVLLAPAWAASGIVFHLQRYAELNWAADYFGGAFLVQSALLLGLGLFGRAPERPPGRSPMAWVGAAITLFGLVGYPLIASVGGHGWSRSEVFALHPEPTVLVTLGIALVVLVGVQAALAAVIPILWIGIATLTLAALQADWAWVLLGVMVFALAGVVADRVT
ncbi:MAG: MFS transporter permease, partial [Gammaproteobacteria bacterium]|nr:MFS transporter permease [Gammaproteobacteria bacterium]